MRLVVTRLRSLVRDDSGQDLLEYALLIALIALACVVAVTAAGTKVSAVFTAIAAAIPIPA
jgi:pilus assembly protein Flp/PilA